MNIRNLKISPNEYRKMKTNELYEMTVEGTFHRGDLIGLLEYDSELGYTGSAKASVVCAVNRTQSKSNSQCLSVRFVDLFDPSNEFLNLAE
ncbi:hypothetical protein NIE88_00140 [Sporolactobacillus shoreicorticis]|uniref:DUF3850 domain-containing protein n=1 Tax=Sporolactobacillus shoreicorticis TaxID=1923877 RepID=A0ABW5S387_9BACL|nr:hypothetical protein [Sporolactobacillus shoreicorticis]MCO7124199.1 hypothetical protein [Sporolactobacillus shoreicorticis]